MRNARQALLALLFEIVLLSLIPAFSLAETGNLDSGDILKDTNWGQGTVTQHRLSDPDGKQFLFAESSVYMHPNGKWVKRELTYFGEKALRVLGTRTEILYIQVEINGTWQSFEEVFVDGKYDESGRLIGVVISTEIETCDKMYPQNCKKGEQILREIKRKF